ncbi:MAG TPA: DUF4013 domain-containing protein [Methanospirillum sp.]|uniref:DUF4013 domain-containing protein n=1 Tax=Methanospirillum sp. TaxID=45200 RepID=UPI002CE8377A|nr:DUF4013 domain-containing protein [Methanospirillum sp.]HOJ95511.1 DUF4013 domain-containing protein [Methanospirillum sp.]HOL41086.1 DUF4013 domain-containing protein [Methanospirillum sp.]HPP78691.1 DUF4013 domain-containing protein [Methanospirillum sp.]
MRVYGDENETAPEIDGYGRLFVGGWKMNIVTILYLILAIIIAVAFGAIGVLSALAGLFTEGKITHITDLVSGASELFRSSDGWHY